MNPAASIIVLCGGHAVVAAICGVNVSRVHRWTYPRGKRGGTGGIIPVSHQQTLLSGARARGIDLRPEHFFAAVPQMTPRAQQNTVIAKNAIAGEGNAA